jgi:hypothetical protein
LGVACLFNRYGERCEMNTVKKILAGNQFTKSRLHDQKGNLIDLEGLLYLPHSLSTTILRLSVGRRPELPWLGYRAIRHLEGLLEPDWKVLEFGSGMSTLWFAKRCHTVVSIEDNEQWYLEILSKPPSLGKLRTWLKS